MKTPALQNKQVVILWMAFRARKVIGTFEKRAPEICIPCLWIPDSTSLHSGFKNLDSGLQLWLDSGSISWIQDSKAVDSGFHRLKLPGFRIPDYFTWGEGVISRLIFWLIYKAFWKWKGYWGYVFRPRQCVDKTWGMTAHRWLTWLCKNKIKTVTKTKNKPWQKHDFSSFS